MPIADSTLSEVIPMVRKPLYGLLALAGFLAMGGGIALPAASGLATGPAERQQATTSPAPSGPTVPEDALVVPSKSVLGLQLETAVTSERAQVEDSIVARVTRDVMANGRVAIGAGARATGSVTLVDRGDDKGKQRARLGIRFHTLDVPGAGRVPIDTETVFRDSGSTGTRAAARIGGAAAGGAVIGAILGGGRGAAIGGGVGAAGGAASVLSHDREVVELSPGTPLSVRTLAPFTIKPPRRLP